MTIVLEKIKRINIYKSKFWVIVLFINLRVTECHMIFNIIREFIVNVFYDMMKFVEIFYMVIETKVTVVDKLTCTDKIRICFYVIEDIV